VTQQGTRRRGHVAVTASGAKLTYTAQACALKPAPAAAGYSIGTNAAGKKTIRLRLPYGAQGAADYTFVEL
jgi:hypothetical protein